MAFRFSAQNWLSGIRVKNFEFFQRFSIIPKSLDLAFSSLNSAFLAVLECKNPLWKFSNPTLQPRSELRARKVDFFQRVPKIAKSLHMAIFRPDMRFSVLKDIKNLNLKFSWLFDFQLKTGPLVQGRKISNFFNGSQSSQNHWIWHFQA